MLDKLMNMISLMAFSSLLGYVLVDDYTAPESAVSDARIRWSQKARPDVWCTIDMESEVEAQTHCHT